MVPTVFNHSWVALRVKSSTQMLRKEQNMNEFAGDSLHFALQEPPITFHFASVDICIVTLNHTYRWTGGRGAGGRNARV